MADPERLRPSVEPQLRAAPKLPAMSQEEARAYRALGKFLPAEVVAGFRQIVDGQQQLEEKGRQVRSYYERDDLPMPDDDETARPSPFKNSRLAGGSE